MKFRNLFVNPFPQNEWCVVVGAVTCAVMFSALNGQEVTVTVGVLSLLSGFIWTLYQLSLGWRLSRKRRKYGHEELSYHQFSAAILLSWILVGVVCIEFVVRRAGGLWGDPSLVTLHLSFVACFLVCLVMVFFMFTGLVSKRLHRLTAILFTVFYGALLVTGGMLLKELPSRM